MGSTNEIDKRERAGLHFRPIGCDDASRLTDEPSFVRNLARSVPCWKWAGGAGAPVVPSGPARL